MKFSRRRTIAAAVTLAAAGAAGWATRAAAARYYDGPVSDHFDGTRFLDPDGAPPRSFFDLLRWRASPAKVQWAAWAPSPFARRRALKVRAGASPTSAMRACCCRPLASIC